MNQFTTIGTAMPLTRKYFMEEGCDSLVKGELKRAEKMLQAALNVSTEDETLSHPAVGECLILLANLRMVQQKPEEAEPFYKLAALVYKEAYGEDHANHANAIERARQARDIQNNPKPAHTNAGQGDQVCDLHQRALLRLQPA